MISPHPSPKGGGKAHREYNTGGTRRLCHIKGTPCNTLSMTLVHSLDLLSSFPFACLVFSTSVKRNSKVASATRWTRAAPLICLSVCALLKTRRKGNTTSSKSAGKSCLSELVDKIILITSPKKGRNAPVGVDFRTNF